MIKRICKRQMFATVLLVILFGNLSGKAVGSVNIKEFSTLVKADDWSGAIQAAIDHISVANGYKNGATIYFPPGIYRIDKPLILGKDRSHHGIHLSGYGAVLLGTKKLDEQPLNYNEREKAFKDAKSNFNLLALPGELDEDGKNVGVAILELWNPPFVKGTSYTMYEGASFVLEGLTFDREVRSMGVGVKIPAETVPKNVTFRDIKVHNQNVGIHINHSYQVRLESCIIRGNKIGLWGRNHFNSVSVINSTFRRNDHHGMVIGPNAGSWGSSAIHIAGNIFEANKGYGILNAGGNQVTVIGNYFEANGNDVGVLTPYGNTTIETNLFWSFFGHGWEINSINDTVVSNKAHIVVSSQNVHIRSNKYYGGEAILVFGLDGTNTFDSMPTVVKGVKLRDGLKVAASSGIGMYVYDNDIRKFKLREFAIHAEQKSDSANRDTIKKDITRQNPTCNICGHVYDSVAGDVPHGIAAGTTFEFLPDTWVCPACGASKKQFLPTDRKLKKRN